MKTHLKAQSIRIAILCVLLVVCVGLTVAVVATWPQRGFVPPKVDDSARAGVPNLTPEQGFEFTSTACGQGVIGLSSQCRVEGRQLIMYFANREDSDVWALLELRRLEAGVAPEDLEVIASTGLLLPGSYVPSMTLPRGLGIDDIKEGFGLFVVMFEPNTYSSRGVQRFEISFAD
jgi:hypothetical protein